MPESLPGSTTHHDNERRTRFTVTSGRPVAALSQTQSRRQPMCHGASITLSFASITQAPAPAKLPTEIVAISATPAPPATPPPSAEKPVNDVVAGAIARAASQSTIHPLDTLKVRLQIRKVSSPGSTTSALAGAPRLTGPVSPITALRGGLVELGSLYKGVVGAATGAGVIIGAYFAFYSTSKRFLREHTTAPDGTIAFMAGAAAAVGSSVVKVPIAVCIRSVQAGVYNNAAQAATSIYNAAGIRGLFTGFLPTLLEDVPDMAVKFAVYETLRPIHKQVTGKNQPSALEDLLMGGVAGAAAAAATTPLDVVKTRMMCTASSRPSIRMAVQSVVSEGLGVKGFFRGVGPRALSNGLNSAIFFAFFEAFRRVLVSKQQDEVERVQQRLKPAAALAAVAAAGGSQPAAPMASLSMAMLALSQQHVLQHSSGCWWVREGLCQLVV